MEKIRVSGLTVWVLLEAVSTLGSATFLALAALRAASLLHVTMVENVLKAPMSFFETTPLGRIVNRFAKDVDVLDNTLGVTFRSFLSCFFSVSLIT